MRSPPHHQSLNEAFGIRPKLLRQQCGFTQIRLADRIDISFQQLQKYEKGANALTLARLLDIADAMEVTPEIMLTHIAGVAILESSFNGVYDLYSLDVVSHFNALPSDSLRESVRHVLQALAETEHGA